MLQEGRDRSLDSRGNGAAASTGSSSRLHLDAGGMLGETWDGVSHVDLTGLASVEGGGRDQTQGTVSCRREESLVGKDMDMPASSTASFTRAKVRKQRECPSLHRWVVLLRCGKEGHLAIGSTWGGLEGLC